MGWFLKALLAVILIVFAIDAKDWLGQVLGIALDQKQSKFEAVVEGRESLFDEAMRDACSKLAAEASKEPQKLTVSRQLVKEGDTVRERQPLVELVAPRYSIIAAAPVNGKIKRLPNPEGMAVPDGAVLAEIEVSGEKDAEGKELPTQIRNMGVVRPGTELESPIPISILELGEDIDRRATAILEAALVAHQWKVEARASMNEELSKQDLRAMLEQVLDRMNFAEVFNRHGVDRLVFGRINSVEYPSVQRCEVDLWIRALHRNGTILFDHRASGAAGPIPGVSDWIMGHPWRFLGLVLLGLWLAVAVFTRGRAIPYVARAQDEAKDAQASTEARRISHAAQEIIVDLRRLQDDAARRGWTNIARHLHEQGDRLDQIRQRLEQASRAQQRRADEGDLWSKDLTAEIRRCVQRYSAAADAEAADTSVREIASAIESFRTIVHSKTDA